MPYESIERLLNDESFVSKEWFPTLSFDRQRIASSLLRLNREGFIVCRPDSRVDGPIIKDPDRTQMFTYWFSPTAAGEMILTYTAPWDLELDQCQLPNERTTTWQFIEEFRKDPEPWDYMTVSKVHEPNRALIGWTSYRATLIRGAFEKIATHVVEITQSRPLNALQAHFRLLEQRSGLAKEPPTSETSYRLSLLDLLLLDILTVDVESLAIVAHILNHRASPYSAWLSSGVSLLRNVRKSAARLVEAGYAVPYRESTEGRLHLEPSIRSRVDQGNLWLGITPEGVQARDQRWTSAFSKYAAAKSKA